MGCESFGGVKRDGVPGMREGVPSTLFVLAAVVGGVTAPGVAANGPSRDNPAVGARGILGVPAKATEGFDPKRVPTRGLVSGADGVSVLDSGLGVRLNTPGFIPPNALGAVGIAGFVDSSTAGFVSGFTGAPREKPLKFSIDTGAATVGAAVAEEDEGLSLRGTPFVMNGGGVFGLGTTEEVGLLDWSIKGST